MGHKILLPTDFSKNSWNAIQYAINLYENCECDFYILNTYTPDTYGRDSSAVLDPHETFNKLAERRSSEGLGGVLTRLVGIDKDLNHRFHVMSRSAPFLEGIKAIVEDQQIDMIILGSKGMTNDSEGKYGKNALDAIGGVRRCPVLVVPENVKFDRPEEIVLATNFNSDCKIHELEYLAQIANITNASIQVLSLADNTSMSPDQKNKKMLLRRYFKDVNYSFSVLPYEEMASALNSFMQTGRSDMITYIDRKPSFLERMGFGKPSLGKLGYYKDVPVMALHA